MSKNQPNDTDLIKELVKNFGENQKTLAKLVMQVEEQSKSAELDILAQSKLKALRREILIEDVKGQDKKIEMITSVLDEICSTPQLPNA